MKIEKTKMRNWTGVLVAVGAAVIAFVNTMIENKKEEEFEDLKERVSALENQEEIEAQQGLFLLYLYF